MALNKTILKKVSQKTKDDKELQEFILTILDEENKGLGQFKKKYKSEIDKAVKGEKKEI